MSVPRRLACLERRVGADGVRVFVADTAASRLVGLAGMAALPADCALLIPRCRSVHTFGMRFALDIEFLDDAGQVLRREHAVPPRRMLWDRRAAAVLERPAA